MEIAAKLDEMGKPAWIGLMVFSFVVFWPLGLALLAFLIWSGRMGCGRHRARWRSYNWTNDREDGWFKGCREDAPSGNRAFDDYRAETLRRLEEEQREFKDFLDRLRYAKDKAEFDEFLAQRRPGSDTTEPSPRSV